MTRQSQSVRTPAGRYGARRPPRVFYAVGGMLLLALIVLVVSIGQRAGTPEVSYGVRAFATAERSVRITFEVRKPVSQTAVCTLRARDRLGAEVGRREVTIGPATGGGTVVRTETLATSGRPVTGEVNGCGLTG